MRKLMMTTMMLFLAVSIIAAQPGQGKRGASKANLYSQLDLTADQQEQIKTIKMEARAKAKASKEQAWETKPDRTAMKQLREESRQAIEAVLTPVQKEKLAKISAERKTAWESVDKKALKREMKEYRDSEVIPVVKAARGQLNQFISAEDQQVIVRLREVFKDQRLKSFRGQHRAGKPAQRPTPEQVEGMKAERQAWRDAHTAEIAELKTLTTKYQADLKRIQSRLQPQIEVWGKEKKEIMRSHLPEDALQKAAPNHSSKVRKGEAQKPGKTKGKGGQRKKAGREGWWPHASVFLLMEG